MSTLKAIMVMIAVAAITVLGDYFLKIASQQSRPVNNKWFFAGLFIYAGCSFGWLYAMRNMKLAMIGVVYSLATVLPLAALDVLVFGETLNRYEVAGIGFAMIAILLLSRFSG